MAQFDRINQINQAKNVGTIMKVSVFNLFSIGIRPSSSYTVGPMHAASAFINQLVAERSAILRTTHLSDFMQTPQRHDGAR